MRANGAHVLAGVGNREIVVWAYIEGRWNFSEAVRFYGSAALTVLPREYPHRRHFTLLEDNDSTVFKSKAAVQAKDDYNLDVFEIPKHSPQLNALDYYLWGAVDKRMRATERRYPANKKEKRCVFLCRLMCTTKSTPRQDVVEAQRSMQVRCGRLVDAEGGQIEG